MPNARLRCLLICLCLALAGAVRAADSVAIENAKPGTTAWQLTNPASMFGVNSTNPADYAVAEIQGYASKASLNQGGSIDFFVRTINTNSYTLAIYRIGWYGGAGGRLMFGPVTLPGVVQPMPPAPVFQPAGSGLVECNWTSVLSMTIPVDWVSGVYLVKLSLSSPAAESYIVFVVRDDARPSAILVQSEVATYQAYNEWGGSSLYSIANGAKTGYKVSFNRPYWRNFGAGDFVSLNGNPGYEINLVRWLESQGYDVTYATDIDTHENPTLLSTHQVFIVNAHSEYWSWNMRDAVENGRDAGTNLMFLGANGAYWQVRFEASTAGVPDRTVVGYKELASMDPVADRRLVTTLWRNIRPEGPMMGVEYNDASDVTPSDMIVTNASHWLFTGAGVTNGSIFPNVLGYETDSLSALAPPGTTVLAHSPFPKGAPQVNADMTIYTAASGANVLAAGTVEWVTGLDGFAASRGVVPGVQKVTANFLARAMQGPAPANPRLPATVTTSSAAVAYPAINAGDSNISTQWVATLDGTNPNNNNAWIQLDFGARMQLQRLKWIGAATTPYPAYSPTNYSIQTSDDGTNWLTQVTRTNTSPVVNGLETLTATARFLRMVTTKVGDGSGWSLSFFEFWAEGSPAPTGPTLVSVSLNPASVTGTNPSTGTVTLSGPAPAGGATVTLSSDTPAVASVPASVTVPASATTATFTVTTIAVAASTAVNVSASDGTTAPKTAALTVLPPVLSALAVSPASVTGGTASTGTATLNAPAPGGGAVVSLSSNAAAASVPASVTVAAGATSATFTVATTAVGVSTAATISGAYGSTQAASLTILPPVLSSLALSPTSVTGGSSSAGTLTLNGPAPAGGALVALSSGVAAASVPAGVTVPAGATSATFSVTTTAVATSTAATITGSYGATQTAVLTILPPVLSSLTLNPSTVTGGFSSTGTVALNGPAPAGGAVVALSSSDTSSATVPASVTVAAGGTTATFTVNTSVVVFSTSVTISGSLNGSSQSANLTVKSLVPGI
jgi:hypothetical protein